MTAPRQTVVEVTWEAIDISRNLAPFLKSLDFADNLTGAADDIGITLHDRDGKWSSDWRPQFGDTVSVRIKATPWLTDVSNLLCGTFAHDKIGINGPPREVMLKCVSAPLATELRRRKRTRGWSSRTLKGIAQDIADRAELKLSWDGDEGLTYKRREQKEKSDLEFLEELCKEVGRNLKVREGQIAIFDQFTRDSAAVVGDISLKGGHVLSWSFDSDDSGRYGSCVISFFDPRNGKARRYQFPADGVSVPGLDPNGQTLEINMPVDSIGEGTAKAKALLRNANRFATSGRIVTVGDPGLVAGMTFNLTDAFGFDGKFIVTKATHRPVGGYVCTLDVRRCLEGY